MKVFPRSSWTSHLPSETQRADRVDDLLFFSKNIVRGIMIHADMGAYELLNRDPNAHFDTIRRNDVGVHGFSDIKYNLGVAPRVEGVWELRGLVNKGAGSDTPEFNSRYIHVYCQLAADEKPTDVMLQNLVDARHLVLSLYPNATEVIGHTNHGSRTVVCPGEYLLQVVESSLWDSEPTVSTEGEVPSVGGREGDQSIHVYSLISMLNYLGYYRQKNTGKYDSGVSQAVKELQVDLKEGGFYKRTIDGHFGPYTRKGWNAYLSTLRMIASR